MTEDRSWTLIELSPGHAPPAGAFSPAVEAAGLVLAYGQVPLDPVSGQWVKDRPLKEQGRQVFSNLALTVGAAGLEVRDLASVSVFLADTSHSGGVNKIFQECFSPRFPAPAVVGAALEGFLIEVAAVAVRSRPAEARR